MNPKSSNQNSSDSILHSHKLPWTALAALGVVYGDIGTSPLYALREAFAPSHNLSPTPDVVLGLLSLLFWILMIVICVKYMVFVLRADNRGEGGILALTALVCPPHLRHKKPILFALGLIGAAFLYGDGIITPAISVLSAVEGLKVATPVFDPYVVPITVVILSALFWIQRSGTAKLGAIFGPIILIWFIALGVLGIRGIIQNPHVLEALNPLHAFEFFLEYKKAAFLSLGALFLVVTGGEALYADMGHFGRKPIRWAWFTVVLPGLVLNYFGQGALLLSDPTAAENPFFLLAPRWFLYPLVGLAALAAVIASQALISGVYSVTKQAIQLGLIPRLQIVHTSSKEMGQIYMPHINAMLLIGCLWLVFAFKTSGALAAAYGISVSVTMVITTLYLYAVARQLWKWKRRWLLLATALFLVIDLGFLAANLHKVMDGGYVPILIGCVIFVMMTTWQRGRQILAEKLRSRSLSQAELIELMRQPDLARVPGVAVFMVGDPYTTPPAIVHNLKHNRVLHELVIILSITTKEIPTVPEKDRVRVEKVEKDFIRVIGSYGFMDSPDAQDILSCLADHDINFDPKDAAFFLGREILVASEKPGMAIWREHLFAFMSRNAQRATSFFNIPADQVFEVGIQVEL